MSILFNYYSFAYDFFMKSFKLDNNEEIVKYLKNKKNTKIADIGGGTGLLAAQLTKLNHDVTIIDPAIKMTNIAKNRDNNIKVINQSFNDLTFDFKYDVIIFKDCLHHLDDFKSALLKAIKILSENGIIIVQDFNPNCYSSKMIFMFERLCLEKIYPISIDEIKELFVEYNLNVNINILNKRDYIIVGDKNE